MTTFTGTIPTIASGDTTTVPTNLATYRDALKAASEAWTSFGSTSSITGSTTNPSGGTWTGHYKQVGKSVEFWIKFVHSATVGSGSYSVVLPVAPVTNHPGHFDVFVTDVSSSARYRGVTFGLSGSTVSLGYDANGATNAALGALSAAAPFTMAVGDIIEIQGSYEAA